MKRTPFKPRSKPMNRGASTMARSVIKKVAKPMKSRGMKGSAPTVAEKAWHSALASLGCIACYMDQVHQPVVSIHHIDGRTKDGAHLLCLPLCAGHHQDGTGNDRTLIAVHPYKKRFELRYGTQLELLEVCRKLLTVAQENNTFICKI